MIREAVRGRGRGRRSGGPGERRDARFVRGRDARRRTEGVELDVAARDGREHGHDGAAAALGPRAQGVAACRSTSSGRHGRARRSPTRVRAQAVEVGLPTREQALLVSPTSPACLAAGRARAASGGAPRLGRRACGSSAASNSWHWSARATAATCSRSSAPSDAPPRPLQVRDRRRRRAQRVREADRDRVRGRRERRGTPRGRCSAGPIWELVRDHRYGIYFLDGGRSFLPAGKPDRWVFGMELGQPSRRRRRADHGADHTVDPRRVR